MVCVVARLVFVSCCALTTVVAMLFPVFPYFQTILFLVTMYRSSIQSQDNFEKSSESFELNVESLFHNVSFLVLAVADFKATAKNLYFHDSIWKQIQSKI